ncbi:MAG: type II toxin-antitoxin system VapC family toxin [Nostoc sp. NMS1]|uniref:type II toxin-antitoxin system VapC family toxin n=1 Tax=unclassified Nostoc TaxID=2593658 RepID=UPI0025D6E54E|nr:MULTISPECIES: type II toxin-antitoxin system VapC family toxin [unclassified Nostoc]MBN3908470.1 type II toxin-antitoxin system VapC family toxin [Nostoc sp. NMS1]MBN3989402.1 type II toxin-antitoxin system VapC family toxin [Nostoc sp. NMS2]
MTRVLCLDTSVWIPYLVPEFYQPQSRKLVAEALSLSIPLVAPAFAWAEVGSVLRKKTRMGVITTEEALGFFEDFCELPIDYIEEEAIRSMTWKIADKYGLSTLYDAAFLACAESTSAEFWTADTALVRQLTPRPAYLREIGEI